MELEAQSVIAGGRMEAAKVVKRSPVAIPAAATPTWGRVRLHGAWASAMATTPPARAVTARRPIRQSRIWKTHDAPRRTNQTAPTPMIAPARRAHRSGVPGAVGLGVPVEGRSA
jgi:hypothetical protein